jgi:Tfp pilus assembly protein PilF
MTNLVRSVVLFAVVSLAACASAAAPARSTTARTSTELLTRGLDYAQAGDDLAAEQYLSAARAAGEPEDRVVRELIKVCVRAGRLEQARQHGENYVERFPDDKAIRYALASIYFAKGDALAARHELERLVAEWPEHAESHFLLALILRDQYSDMSGARRSLEQYLVLAPTGAHAVEARGWIKRSATFPVSATSARRTP